ncbi:hypothetical protein [Roseibium alexandrii]|uniref:Uncharacterized protein n=1 Tax=Roseibium alexandrii (strain DSM 17067 / NCIMB 14079 / DFL-11) TaxID=244592 RepID=A0A5E8H3Y0_ROSAD|nr:hypothetical protein [Roseibium alexandrii]EEE46643.2 hypothetical protein SADFL11_3932 [Roseibium alexandrii DFL-11]
MADEMGTKPVNRICNDMRRHETANDPGWKIAILTGAVLLGLGDLVGSMLVDALGPALLHWAELVVLTPIAVWIIWRAFFDHCPEGIWPARVFRYGIGLAALGTYVFTLVTAIGPGLFPKALSGPHGPPLYFEATGVLIILALTLSVWSRWTQSLPAFGGSSTTLSCIPPECRSVSEQPALRKTAAHAPNMSPNSLATARTAGDDHEANWPAAKKPSVQTSVFSEMALETIAILSGLAILAAVFLAGLIFLIELPWWVRLAF